MSHIPVLVKEVLEYLDPKPGENFIDGTVGQSGHSILILKKNKPDGRVLGIDLDFEQIKNSRLQTQQVKERIILVHDSYANIKDIAQKNNFKPVHGILLDLGYSSWQLENSKKGFSFSKDELLDMRYNLENTLTAEKIVNEYSESQIQRILEEYGEEKFARQIAKKIIETRDKKKIRTTFDLMDVIVSAVRGKRYAIPMLASGDHRGLSIWAKAHIGARSFQALRIAVNGELESLKTALPDALSVLASGGRLAVISFHSLEDRIVKNFFKDSVQEGIATILTKKPVTAKED